MTRLTTLPILIAIGLGGCGRSALDLPPSATDGGALDALIVDLAPNAGCDRSHPERPCPPGCGCEEISGLCRPIPQSPDAICVH